jgi:Reverse transcriptase (RNA-dependent DNA polymerase)
MSCPYSKRGRKTDPGNYRPVSLTSVSCRILESVIKDKIVTHLDRHRLIKNTQHGFMKGRSCASNLLTFLEKVTASLDNGEAVDVIYLDFAKAFDTVPHERLKKKPRPTASRVTS